MSSSFSDCSKAAYNSRATRFAGQLIIQRESERGQKARAKVERRTSEGEEWKNVKEGEQGKARANVSERGLGRVSEDEGKFARSGP